METTDTALLQLCYAGALVDAANNYAQLGATQTIGEKKQREQRVSASRQLLRFGVTTPSGLLKRMMEVFGCTAWKIEEETTTTTRAVTPSCLMCTIAKKSGAASPCTLFCISPMKAFANAMEPSHALTIEETLWEGNACSFVFERQTG